MATDERLQERLAALSPEKRELLMRRLRAKGAVPVTPLEGSDGAAMFPDLEVAAVLDPSIQPQGLPLPLGPPRRPLVTGANGFLGAFLVRELLKDPEVRVVCLVRAPDDGQARDRMLKSLRSYELLADLPMDRLEVVAADLSVPMFGLGLERHRALAQRIDAIYHSAAYLNFVFRYEAFVPSNVTGTREVLRFACTGPAKAVHHISTTAFFTLIDHSDNPPVIGEEGTLPLGRRCCGGYQQSKWVAEQLVATAKERGLPITVHRLGLITGHSETGVGHVGDIFTRILRGFVVMRSAPSLDMTIDIAPVDYLARGIVHLSSQESSVGRAFHLVRPAAVHVRQLVEGLRSFGYSIEELPYDAWVQKLRWQADHDKEHPLSLLLPFFTEPWPPQGRSLWEMHVGRPRVDSLATTKALAQASVTYGRADRELGACVKYLAQKGLLPDCQPGQTSKRAVMADQLTRRTDDEAVQIEEAAMQWIEAAIPRGVSAADYDKIAADVALWQTTDAGRLAIGFIYRRLRLAKRRDPSYGALLAALMDRDPYEGFLARGGRSAGGAADESSPQGQATASMEVDR